jgi:hypothetical protein
MWRYWGHNNPFDQKELVKFSYRDRSFVVHDYALGRIPYLHNMIQGCTGTRAPNAKKMVRAGNIDPNGLISKSIGFDFSTEALTVILAWAYDKDTMRLLRRGVLPYEHWLTVAKFMTIAGLDTDLEHIIACQTAQKAINVPSKRWERLTLVAKFVYDAVKFVYDVVTFCVQGIFVLVACIVFLRGVIDFTTVMLSASPFDTKWELSVAMELLKFNMSQTESRVIDLDTLVDRVSEIRRAFEGRRKPPDASQNLTESASRFIQSVWHNLVDVCDLMINTVLTIIDYFIWTRNTLVSLWAKRT